MLYRRQLTEIVCGLYGNITNTSIARIPIKTNQYSVLQEHQLIQQDKLNVMIVLTKKTRKLHVHQYNTPYPQEPKKTLVNKQRTNKRVYVPKLRDTVIQSVSKKTKAELSKLSGDIHNCVHG